MTNFTPAKEFKNKITIDEFDEVYFGERLSNCCGAVIYPDSDICSDCKEHCVAEETCKECEGRGKIDVLDNSKYLGNKINPPIKTIACDACDGKGYIEVEL